MAGIAGLEIFEIKGWEVGWVFGGVDGMAKVVMELEVLGCHRRRKQEAEEEEGIFHLRII